MTTRKSEAARQERPPLTEEHKAKVRAGILSSGVVNIWLPEETATARNLFERGVCAADIAQTVNAIYKRGRTDQAIGSHMNRIGARFGSALQPDEIAADPDIRRRMRLSVRGRGGAEARAETYAEDERHVWHPLHDNIRLLSILGR